MTINAADVRCPKCGGPVWDERGSKKNPKGPDFKCKDVNCKDDKGYKTGIWERDLVKQQSHAPAPSSQKQGYNVPAYVPGLDDGSEALPTEKLDRLFNVWDSCLAHAHVQTKHLFGADVTDEAVIAATATLFIQACKVGV